MRALLTGLCLPEAILRHLQFEGESCLEHGTCALFPSESRCLSTLRRAALPNVRLPRSCRTPEMAERNASLESESHRCVPLRLRGSDCVALLNVLPRFRGTCRMRPEGRPRDGPGVRHSPPRLPSVGSAPVRYEPSSARRECLSRRSCLTVGLPQETTSKTPAARSWPMRCATRSANY